MTACGKLDGAEWLKSMLRTCTQSVCQLESPTGLSLSRKNFQQILRLAEKQGRPDLISEAFKLANIRLVEGDFTVGISACGRLQLWEEACQLFNRMPHLQVSRSAISYSATISACAKSSRWQDGLNFFESMGRMKIKQDVISYNSTITALEKGGEWRHALGLLKQMFHAQLKPDIYTYNASISACGGQWQLALSLLEQMRWAQINRDAFSYSAAINSCAISGQWLQALSLLKASSKVGNVVTYNAAIHACAKGGEWEQALDLFTKMLHAKVGRNVITFSSTIGACGNAGEWQKALNLFDLMIQSQIRSEVHTYNATISACEKGNQWVHALNLFQAMADSRIRRTVISYSATISSFEKSSQWERALNLFDQMFWAVSQDVHSYSATISACEKGGQWQQALSLFNRMPKERVVQDACSYNATISACEKGRQWQGALSLFFAMGGEIQPTLISYNTSISACQSSDHWQKALTLFERMVRDEVWPDKTTYNAILDSWAISNHELLEIVRLNSKLCGWKCSKIFRAMQLLVFHCFPFKKTASLRSSNFTRLGGRIFQKHPWGCHEDPEFIDLHGLSEGAATLALRWWLANTVARELNGTTSLQCIIVTGFLGHGFTTSPFSNLFKLDFPPVFFHHIFETSSTLLGDGCSTGPRCFSPKKS